MVSDSHSPMGRRGFFRSLRDWAVEEGRELAAPILDDVVERFEPVLAEMAGPQLIRPPGARAEAEFMDLCEQCGKCVEACPENAIFPAPESTFPGKAGSPVIQPRRRACYTCEPFHCAEACPTGALVPIAKERMRIGTARLLRSLCFAHRGQPCDTCHAVCPERGKAIVMERGLPVVHPEACTGCGMCEYACPTHPAAIRVFSPR